MLLYLGTTFRVSVDGKDKTEYIASSLSSLESFYLQENRLEEREDNVFESSKVKGIMGANIPTLSGSSSKREVESSPGRSPKHNMALFSHR